MPQRNAVVKIPEPTSLRRSPRLLLLKESPKTPDPTSEITSLRPRSRNISSRTPKNSSVVCAKSSIDSKNCDNGSVNCGKSAIGSGNCPKSANGSRRKSNLGSGIEGKRRSSRFCNEVTSLADARSSCINTRSRRNSKKMSLVGVGNLATSDFVESPVIPIGVGERKCRGLIGDGSDSETSGSLRLAFRDIERRVTRSCSRKLGGNVENRKVQNSKLKGTDLLDSRVREFGVRKCVRPVRGATGKGNGKEENEGGCRSIVCGLGSLGYDFVSPCSTPGVGSGKSCSRKDRRGMEGGSYDELTVEDFEGRITRSVSKRMAKVNDLCGQDVERETSNIRARNVPGKGESRKEKKEKQVCGESIKYRRTERGKRAMEASITPFSARLEEEQATARDIGVLKEFLKCGELENDKVINISSNAVSLCHEPGGEGKAQVISDGTKLVGVKRKRKQAGFQGTDQGWTKDQEAALQRAYFAAKPSPHFWKRVSKLVSGKSAQECFDKVHSVNLTPLSTRHSSRVKKQNSPSECLLNGDDFLNSFQTKSKKKCKTKRKSHVTRRNVRHLLQKYCQDSDADLFSVLEPAVNPSAETLKLKAVQLTTTLSSGSPESSSKCRSMSSPGHNKRLSRLSGIRGSPLTSPPVLKKVKNMALHEKYIDQLHIREGKRKVVSSRYLKSVQRQKDGEQNPAQIKNVIKAAKDALVSDARDVIEKFRQSQANLMEAYSDSEEVVRDENEDDLEL